MADDQRRRCNVKRPHEEEQGEPEENCVFTFPEANFGLKEMNVCELKKTATSLLLSLQPCVKYPETGTVETVTLYHNHRVAAAYWFTKLVMSKRFKNMCVDHEMVTPALDIMDRYMTRCTEEGHSLEGLLKDVASIRAACLSLSLKMHAVYPKFNTNTLCLRDNHVYTAWDTCLAEEREIVYEPVVVDKILKYEKDIIVTLKGELFPANCSNTIDVFCKFLILGHLSTEQNTYKVLIERVMIAAFRLWRKRNLDVKLLRLLQWKCMSACCLLAVIEVCINSAEEGVRLEDWMLSTLDELKPGEFTREELSEIKRILTLDCVVCRNADLPLRIPIRRLSAFTCAVCERNLPSRKQCN